MNPNFSCSPDFGPHQAGRAFTLVELLVVMAVIAIVIALLLPALSGGRMAARVAATKGQMTQITNSAAAFVIDERRSPGHFPTRMMGHPDNRTRGMSGMENVIMDLAGWKPGSFNVGPTNTPQEQLGIDPQSVGIAGQGSKQYYVPDKKSYAAQAGGTQQMSEAPHAGTEGDPNQLPDVVDPFGTPILAWTQDESYAGKPSATVNTSYRFGAVHSGNGGAKFYWAQNACFLTATQLGKKAIDQTSTTDGSLLGSTTDLNYARSLTGALGSLTAVFRPPHNFEDLRFFMPLAGRAPVIVQSAGRDGVYLGRRDKGAKPFLFPQGTLPNGLGGDNMNYRYHFAPRPDEALTYPPASPANCWVDKNGKVTTDDFVADFDDLFSYGGS